MAAEPRSAPRLLVQLSDPHVTPPGRLSYGRVDTAAFLARAVAAVNSMSLPPQAVVVTGDLTDSGSAREYAHLRALLRPLPVPIYLVPGNHDDRRALRQAFADHDYLHTAGADDGAGFVHYAVDLGGLRLVTVDTVVPEADHGEVCAQRLAWLDADLAAFPRTPTIVAMHHPPFQTFIGHMDEIGLLRGGEALAEVVARHHQVERVICGHLHRSIQVRWARTVAVTAPSTAHQVCFDLAPRGPQAFAMEPPGFLVHAWSEAGAVVSHLVAVGDFAGPYPFEDSEAIAEP